VTSLSAEQNSQRLTSCCSGQESAEFGSVRYSSQRSQTHVVDTVGNTQVQDKE
jgi:hypothetical protein